MALFSRLYEMMDTQGRLTSTTIQDPPLKAAYEDAFKKIAKLPLGPKEDGGSLESYLKEPTWDLASAILKQAKREPDFLYSRS